MPKRLGFAGKIPVKNHTQLQTSPYAETSWDNDVETLPAQNPAAISQTAWDNQIDDAEENTFAGLVVEDKWT